MGALAYTTPTRDWDFGPVNSPSSRGGYGPIVNFFKHPDVDFGGLVDGTGQFLTGYTRLSTELRPFSTIVLTYLRVLVENTLYPGVFCPE